MEYAVSNIHYFTILPLMYKTLKNKDILKFIISSLINKLNTNDSFIYMTSTVQFQNNL